MFAPRAGANRRSAQVAHPGTPRPPGRSSRVLGRPVSQESRRMDGQPAAEYHFRGVCRMGDCTATVRFCCSKKIQAGWRGSADVLASPPFPIGNRHFRCLRGVFPWGPATARALARVASKASSTSSVDRPQKKNLFSIPPRQLPEKLPGSLWGGDYSADAEVPQARCKARAICRPGAVSPIPTALGERRRGLRPAGCRGRSFSPTRRAFPEIVARRRVGPGGWLRGRRAGRPARPPGWA